MNGEAMTYQLWYNGHKININDNHTMNETFSFKLRDLEAFTNYSIVVEACTSFCSELNENMELRTAMGKPGVMLQPRLELIGNNKLSISWEKPKVVGGNLDYFQLKTVLRNGDEKLYRVSGQARSCVVRSLNCENEKIEFSIRSVNVEFPSITDVDTESFECFDFQELTKGETAGRFYGEWSQTTTFYCPIHFSMSVMAMIFLFSLSSLIFIYAIIRLYQKYKDMKDIHIIWPKGLDPSSPNASPSKKDYLFDPTKDLDLIKDHVLTDIEEEEEKLVPAKGESNVDQRESVRSEVFLPFICNPKTNEVFYSMPKASTVNKKPSTNSTPTSPNYVKFQTKVEKPEYVKMYAPLESPTSPVIEGYLDMTGKSSSTPKIVVTPPIPLSPTTPKDNDYLVNEVKIFIKDSELNNNGYIGKRSSLLSDGSEKKHPMIINSNGYVGLQQK